MVSEKIGDKVKITKFMEVEQNIGKFIVCTMKADDLIFLTKEYSRDYDESNDSYIGIQRKISTRKINEIKTYLKDDDDACFPNSIIINLDPSFLESYSDNEMIISAGESNDEKGVFIIDGQHRLFSLEENNDLKFDLIVAFFIGLDSEEQAYLFSTINNKQQKLNPSQVQDLNDLFTIETPEKVVHIITKQLNKLPDSPWENKINMLGRKIKTEKKIIDGIMSQYSFAKEIIKLIYPMKGYFELRNKLKKEEGNKDFLKKEPYLEYSRKYAFWDYYVNSEISLMVEVLLKYFFELKSEFIDEWGNREFILTKTTGYSAFMKLLNNIGLKEDLTNYNFNPLIKYIKRHLSKPLKNENYPAGLKGQSILYKELSNLYEEFKKLE